MSSSHRRSILGVLVVAALVGGGALSVASAHEAESTPAALDTPRVQSIVRADLEAGRLSLEEYLLENFRLAFAPELADRAYAGEEYRLEGCLTPWVVEFEEARGRLSAAAIEEIEGYLAPPRGLARATYVSPAGLFELTYDTAGTHAVPLDDVTPANGIPDFVERCAEYFDESWNVEVDVYGFQAPNLPGDGTYDVFFQAFVPGLYGVTSTAGFGETIITIDNNFTGTGHVASPDPDGAQLGRAKGVIAHEFKHAVQYVTSGWSESTWLELDANWVMDYVFDESDIYHAWLDTPTSQIKSPQTNLDNSAGAGNYEDLLWQTYLSEKHGISIINDFWDRRAFAGGETVKASYSYALSLYGSTWDEAYPEFMEWCWFTGSRSEPGYGFEEAADMDRMNLLTAAISSYPYGASSSVNQLAAHHRRFNPGTETGYARVVFDGDDAHANWTLSIIAERPDGSFVIVQPTLDAANDADVTVTIPIQDLAYVGVIVTNSKRSGGLQAYDLNVSIEASAVSTPLVAAPLASLELAPASPNPFRSSTRFDYTLPRAGAIRIDVHDVAGRLVRRLVDGTAPAGRGDVTWDGTDAGGRPVPTGVYWARLVTEDGNAVRKATKLR